MLRIKKHNKAVIAIILAVVFAAAAAAVLPVKASLVGNTNGATLKVSPETGEYGIDDTLEVNILVDTKGQNVVVVAAYLNYDKNSFEVLNIDTTASVFNIEAEKEIDSANGVIKITRGKPTPGVNTSEGLVAKIVFKAKGYASPASDNLTFIFTPGSTADSNVILDDGKGTDHLSGVYNSKYTVKRTYTITDFTNLVADWLKSIVGSPADVNSDGVVNSRDLGIMMSNWRN